MTSPRCAVCDVELKPGQGMRRADGPVYACGFRCGSQNPRQDLGPWRGRAAPETPAADVQAPHPPTVTSTQGERQ